MIDTRTQYRATCPICFLDHAVRRNPRAKLEGFMVQHGYRRPEGWHQNVNECQGTNAAHFGTERGRDIAAENAVFIRTWAQARRDDAATLRASPPASVMVTGKYLHQERRYEEVSVDATDHRYQDKVDSMISTCEMQAKHADQSAAEIEQRVKNWKETPPRPEQVPTGPTMHFSWARSRTGVYCTYQTWMRNGGTRQFSSTKDWATVTCSRCLKARGKIESGVFTDIEKGAVIK